MRGQNEDLGRQHQGMNGQAWSLASPRGRWQAANKTEKIVCKVISGASLAIAILGLIDDGDREQEIGLADRTLVGSQNVALVCFFKVKSWVSEPVLKLWESCF